MRTRSRRPRSAAPQPSWLIVSPSGTCEVQGSLRRAQLAAEAGLHAYARDHGAVVYAVRLNGCVVTATTYDRQDLTATLEVAA